MVGKTLKVFLHPPPPLIAQNMQSEKCSFVNTKMRLWKESFKDYRLKSGMGIWILALRTSGSTQHGLLTIQQR